MHRATISIDDELHASVEDFRRSQAARPSLTAVVQAALSQYLGGPRTDPSSQVINLVLANRGMINEIVRRHRGSNPRVFGSVARGEATAASDVDLLVDLIPGATLFDVARMRSDLEQLLEMPVDVVASSGLEGDAGDEILQESISL